MHQVKATLWVYPKRGDVAAQRGAEEFWSARVKTAKLRYEAALGRLRRLVAAQEKWPEPECSDSIRTAQLEESAARNEYVRVLNVFTELLLHGETADSHQPPRPEADLTR